MMSDFLEKFNNDNYKKTKQNQVSERLEKQPETIKEKHESLVETSKVDDQKPVKGSRRIEHENEIIEIDTQYAKKQKKRKVMTICTIILVLIGLVLSILFFTLTSIPDFKNKKQSALDIWAKENNMTLDIERVYHKDVELDTIISQETAAGSFLFKGSSTKFIISKGPDPNEYVVLPDFQMMNQKSVEEWSNKEKVINLKLEFMYHNDIPTGNIISSKFGDETVTKETFKRKDKLTITISKGVKPIEKNIAVADFVDKPKADVEKWAKSNEVKLVIKEAPSDKIIEGNVISQSVALNEKISTEDTFEITVSQGKGIKVPDFSSVSKTNAQTVDAELTVLVKETYSAVGYGKLISQSVPANTIVTGANKKVEVTYSIGRPFIENLAGKNLKELEQYFADMNEKNAKITYRIFYEAAMDPTVVKGTVTKSSVTNDYVEFGSTVNIYIAK